MKKCSDCKENKEESEFYKTSKTGGLRSYCKTCSKIRSRKYLKENPERERQHQQTYRDSHRDQLNAWFVEWRKKNATRAKEISSKARAKRKQALGDTTLPVGFWDALLDFYGWACLSCDSDASLELDHVLPIAKGGKHTVDNFQILCRSCNARKATKSTDYRKGRIFK